MWFYKKRIAGDLERWRAAGWITPAGHSEILKDVARPGGGPNLPATLGILAAVLLGFAMMSFVAANWQDMSRLTRLALLFGGLWTSYAAAGAFFQRGMEAFGHAAVLLGVALFGGSIMLIAQMFHIEGHAPDAILTWALGALFAGLVVKSNPAVALAMVLVAAWSFWESGETGDVHWPFLLGWGAVAAAFYWHRWRPGLHLAGLAMTGWVVALGYLMNHGHAHEIVVMIGLAAAAVALAGEKLWPRLEGLWPGMLGYALVTTFAGLFALQFIDNLFSPTEIIRDRLIVMGVLSLALTLGAIGWGFKTGNRSLLWLGYTGFSIEILSLYIKTVGSLLGSSVFFLVAGLIVSALAALAWRLHAREQEMETVR